MIKYILTALLVFLTFCKEKVENGKTNKIEVFINEKDMKTKRNCFQKNDSIKILKTINILKKTCLTKQSNQNLLTEAFVKEFEEFPCNLLADALNNNAIPVFEIENESDECDKVAVYYNYIIKFIDDDEEHSSESTFILYFIKTEEGNVLLESIGAAG